MNATASTTGRLAAAAMDRLYAAAAWAHGTVDRALGIDVHYQRKIAPLLGADDFDRHCRKAAELTRDGLTVPKTTDIDAMIAAARGAARNPRGGAA